MLSWCFPDTFTSRQAAAPAAAKLLQSFPILCNPNDGSPPGSSVPGVPQARTLERVAISFSNACMHAKSLPSCPTLRPCGQQPTRLLCPWNSPGKNPGVGCHSLLQGIFLTQRSNPRLFCLLHCRQILYPTSHLGSHHFIYEPKYFAW